MPRLMRRGKALERDHISFPPPLPITSHALPPSTLVHNSKQTREMTVDESATKGVKILMTTARIT